MNTVCDKPILSYIVKWSLCILTAIITYIDYFKTVERVVHYVEGIRHMPKKYRPL